MSNLTRDVLIKAVVANEMKSCDGSDYTEQLKTKYHYWEHASSQDLCIKFNQLNNTHLTVDALKP
jgi:hypothetical protein